MKPDNLSSLNLSALRYRRRRGDMIEVFKIWHNIYDKEVTKGYWIFQPVATPQRSRLELQRNSFGCETMEFIVGRSGNISQRQRVGIQIGQDVE